MLQNLHQTAEMHNTTLLHNVQPSTVTRQNTKRLPN